MNANCKRIFFWKFLNPSNTQTYSKYCPSLLNATEFVLHCSVIGCFAYFLWKTCVWYTNAPLCHFNNNIYFTLGYVCLKRKKTDVETAATNARGYVINNFYSIYTFLLIWQHTIIRFTDSKCWICGNSTISYNKEMIYNDATRYLRCLCG